MHINVDYQPTVKELTRGLVAARAKPRERSAAVAVMTIAGGLWLAVSHNPFNKVLGISAVTVSAVVILALLTSRWTLAKQVTPACRATRLTLTDEGCTTETDLTRSEWAWASFLRVSETENYVHLYRTERQIVVIPKRIFSNMECAEVSDFINSRTCR